ncbi:LytTR family DNA-binding domain-containing protein [Croceitalea rosinachiae]|uniref:LytTR family DNA-binding domain-containing protein n=1 Tax=Croceitalea rosinachiae TaxID=3075596 RepID=A0ABU3ABM9_9FLAO|nr:LytTR family DNA-binding domain-containing protein [Croceitalea sp. F388]MDT0606331.1 LytTR family DNA-binding domain-containing protein [Croceitalea sp. F388]
MNVSKLLKVPFPAPKRSLKKFLFIWLLGIGGSLFIFLFNPFEIARQAGELSTNLLLLSLGGVFAVSIIVMEWGIPWLSPNLFKKWNIGKALLWYTLVFLFAGTINFIYKSYLAGFRDFTLQEWVFVLARTLAIGGTVAFFIVGIYQLLNRNKLTRLVSGEEFNFTASDGKSYRLNLNQILYLSSDDNYVDIHYMDDNVRKKLIVRASLKYMETQLVNPISPIQRCHRRFLINIGQVAIQKATSRSMLLELMGQPDRIPVSAQYVKDIKAKIVH